MGTERASWRSEALGASRTLELSEGRIRAHVTGEGPPIVFLHGVLVNANLWRKVVPRLDGSTRVTLDLPLGSHLEPTLDAAARLTAFRKPVLIAWSTEDRFFPTVHAERLAKVLPEARLEWIEGARTFSPEDRPERLVELIGSFVEVPLAA